MELQEIAVNAQKVAKIVPSSPQTTQIEAAIALGNNLIEAWGNYQTLKQQRLALEAKLDADIRKDEIKLEALKETIKLNIQYLKDQIMDNEGKRKAINKIIDSSLMQIELYTKYHVQILLEAKSPEQLEVANRMETMIVNFISVVTNQSALISNQTLGLIV